MIQPGKFTGGAGRGGMFACSIRNVTPVGDRRHSHFKREKKDAGTLEERPAR